MKITVQFAAVILCCAATLAKAGEWTDAGELRDPTRAPLSVSAPVQEAGTANLPAGLQSILIGKHRRAAIIDGETVVLGGKHGDAKLIEVNEGNVVLLGAHGRQVLTLFPAVKITPQRGKVEQSALRQAQGERGRKRYSSRINGHHAAKRMAHREKK